MKQRALFSIFNTDHAVIFAKRLIEAGWEIIASKETVSLLRHEGLPVLDIDDFTEVKSEYGFPGTFHPKVEAALTLSTQEHIELVYVVPYPMAHGNDVGGRTLLALAAKGGRIAVMSIEDMEKVVSQITTQGHVDPVFRQELIGKTFFEMARHYGILAAEKEGFDFKAGEFAFELKNGENPYQTPAKAFVLPAESNDTLSLLNFTRISGESPCFTNLADADCLLQTLSLAAEAYRKNTPGVPYLCVVAKHGNPCGFGASRTSPVDAISRALFGNPRSVWGGEMVVNFNVDSSLAEFILKSERREKLLGDAAWMLDIVLAPFFSLQAVEVLGKRSSRKLMQNPALVDPFLKKTKYDYRFIRGGFLRQPPANYCLDIKEAQHEGDSLSSTDLDTLIIAWATAFSSNHGGNEVALAKDGALLGAGGGPSTFEAAKVAVLRSHECGHDTNKSIFSADAFFPFIDAVSVLCQAGTVLGVVPSGGKREIEVRSYFKEKKVTVFYLPQQYRGFCRH
ncbi:MAG: hypothetical protein HQL14_05070 [Candidatus Omnitrophica bacterium]|nr:hypothetical protein [Candidatus Omnitrophota bacterium]